MSGRGCGCRDTRAQGAEQDDREPELQQALQYLMDLIVPLAARLTAIVEQLADQVWQDTPIRQETPIQEEILEGTLVDLPLPSVYDGVAEQEAWLRLVERYQKLKASEFYGSSDSIAAHKQKEDVSNILDMLNVNTVQKQRLAAFNLKGDVGE